ncbi:hypothetical protein HPP92_027038 [Vanilla planifolia]|uniref:Uncharacterized protein n=1 Tax=Vanilla planifolia TaxID=51239 RepID=A0A835PDL0_VANPL|nr:hypothetical protein HPP92_027038 [Vanilla planifolia]
MTGGGFQLDTGDGKSSPNSIQQLSPSARKVIGDNPSHLDHGISDWLYGLNSVELASVGDED